MSDVQELSHQVREQGKKIDKLTDAVTTLVRLDTKLSSHHDTLQRYGTKFEEHGKRLHDIEIKVPLYDDKILKANWIWKVVASALVLALLGTVVVGV